MLTVEVIDVIHIGEKPSFKVKDVITGKKFDVSANVHGGYADQHGRMWTHKGRKGNIHTIDLKDGHRD